MSREKQIEEMADKLCTTSYFCTAEDWDSCDIKDSDEYCHRCRKVAERLYNAGYRKQSEGEWVERTKTTTNAKGMEARYTINFCSECGYEIGTIRYQHKFCPNCGAKMKGGE